MTEDRAFAEAGSEPRSGHAAPAARRQGPLAQAAASALDAIYPPSCLVCDEPVAAPGLCAPCWRETPFLDGRVCDFCGVALRVDGDPGFDADEAPIDLSDWAGEPESSSGAARPRCRDCAARPRPWSQGRAVARYEAAARELVLKLKYADRLDLAPAMGALMARAGAPLWATDRAATLLAPAPLHWSRRLGRRFNQSSALARATAAAAGLRAAPGLLIRTRATRRQAGLTAQERRDNVADAFRVARRRRRDVDGARVVVIDDVFTSGATLEACARALLAAGCADVKVLTFARAAKDWDF